MLNRFLIVNYEHSNFSVSQAVFDPHAQSHIVSLASSSTASGLPPNPTSTNGPIVKTTTKSRSHGIGTGAIAGIVIAIVIIATLCGAFFIFRRHKRHRSSKLNKDKSDVESYERKGISEGDEDSKHDFSEDLEAKKPKAATVTVSEVVGPMTPPAEVDSGYPFPQNEKEQPQSRTFELPGSPPNRSELSTPEPWARELPSPDPEAIRSELSTPDPIYNQPELPSPDPSHEMASSPGLSSLSSGQPSPPLDENRRSALRSPARLPFQRPISERMDSSESEAGWTRDGMPHRPFHRRYQSDESLSPSLPSRPLSSRTDSSESEGLGIRTNRADESEGSQPIVSPITTRRTLNGLDSSSDSDASAPSPQPTPNRRAINGLARPFYSSSNSRPAIRRSIHDVTSSRPYTIRTDSSDSEAWQTRLDSASTENPSDVSRFPSMRRERAWANRGSESLSEEEEEEVREERR